jgi:hypothetical protein
MTREMEEGKIRVSKYIAILQNFLKEELNKGIYPPHNTGRLTFYSASKPVWLPKVVYFRPKFNFAHGPKFR